MKRLTALKNVHKIIYRLKSINGLLATPMESHSYIKVKRVWLFGSVLKGSDTPNDIDLFIELAHSSKEQGIYYDDVESHITKSRRKKRRSDHVLHGGFRINKRHRLWKSIKHQSVIDNSDTFIFWLRKNIPNVSVHYVYHDRTFFKLDRKCLIYPRCDFNFDEYPTEHFKIPLCNKRPLPR